MGLYHSGAATGGYAGSQFKDPNLAFFWGDATEVVIDIFDQKQQRVANISFALPGVSFSQYENLSTNVKPIPCFFTLF